MSQIPDKSNPETPDPDSPLAQAERRSRMRLEWQNLIEELIAEAREGGKFDNLPGAGKPLNLQRNLFAPEQDLAHQLLKDNDLAPAWIMERNDLLAAIKTLRTAVAAGWARHRREFDLLPAARDATSGRWYDMCRAWDAELAALNKRIVAYNLKRPGEQLELYQLDLDDELRRVGGTRWLRA
ncbi:MAG: DUF1992 domain-containing protein [Anaerolineales bacterium]|nr:DUF1992 domain-containing protein [Anaerolineales bacterium]